MRRGKRGAAVDLRDRMRAGSLLVLFACLVCAFAVSASAAWRPVTVRASAANGTAVVTVHSACAVRARVQLYSGARPRSHARTLIVRRGATRVARLRVGAPVTAARIVARVLGRGCRVRAGQVLRLSAPATTAGPLPPPPPPAASAASPPPTIPASTRPPAAAAAPVAGPKLAWAPPALQNPGVINVTAANHILVLDQSRDYIIRMPSRPLSVSRGLCIWGGHNVVLVGGEIDIPWQGNPPPEDSRRALYLEEQTGTMHVEGLLMTGPDIDEGIDIDERLGATVQIENVRIEHIHARDEVGFTDNHPDLIQTWGGPKYLRVDRLTGQTDHQGFFLHPQQFDRNANTLLADLRHVDIAGTNTAGYLLWQADTFWKHLDDVWVQPNPIKPWETLWPSPGWWADAHLGRPPGGDFVPAGTVGANYVSPGYASP
jgi:hypothetical protein